MKYCNTKKVDELERMLEDLSFLDTQRLYIIAVLQDYHFDEDAELDEEYEYELEDKRNWSELADEEKLTLISMVEDVYYETCNYTLGRIADCVMLHKVGVIKDLLGTNEIIDFLIYD